MPEFNILEHAGLLQVKKRERQSVVTEEDRASAERLDHFFYDGDRDKGYGGYFYDGRWKKVAEVIAERYDLSAACNVLVDRCHKGFLVHDLKILVPAMTVYGIHSKRYAINHAMDGYGMWTRKNTSDQRHPSIIESEARDWIAPFLLQADSYDIPFKNGFFDTVISIENACAYHPRECSEVVREIVRVTKDKGKNSYIQNDSWRNEAEKEKLKQWTLLCKTFLSIPEWEALFKKENFQGDWGYTIIE